MIFGLIYALLHLFAGPIAAVWTWYFLKGHGVDDGCLRWLATIAAFLLWPIALCVLLILWAKNFVES